MSALHELTTMRLLARALIVSALSCAIACSGPALAAAPQVRQQAPGFYRMMLGQFEITALLDGTHPFPVDEVMTNARPGEVPALLSRADVQRPVEGSINAFLVNTGTKLILIDSGAGVLYGDCCGHLMANLRAAGYTPGQVDDVYLTHLHRDHVGGVNANGAMAFPNAIVHVSKVDAAYWTDRSNEKTAPAFLDTMFDGAIDSLKPYIAAGRLQTFEPNAALDLGLRSVPTAGHTPGHTGYIVESDGQKLLVWGDIVHVAPIQFPDAGVRLKYDSDQAAAEKSRRALFADAARNGYWIAAAHISFPGLGHVVPDQGRFAWEPAPYTTWLAPRSSPAASAAR